MNLDLTILTRWWLEAVFYRRPYGNDPISLYSFSDGLIETTKFQTRYPPRNWQIHIEKSASFLQKLQTLHRHGGFSMSYLSLLECSSLNEGKEDYTWCIRAYSHDIFPANMIPFSHLLRASFNETWQHLRLTKWRSFGKFTPSLVLVYHRNPSCTAGGQWPKMLVDVPHFLRGFTHDSPCPWELYIPER